VRQLENEETKFRLMASYLADDHLADDERREDYDVFRFAVVDEVLDNARALQQAGEYGPAIERFTFARHLMHDRREYYEYIDAEIAHCQYELRKANLERESPSP
jgi:hypothetical protein